MVSASAHCPPNMEKVQSPEKQGYYINVETIRYVAQNAKVADLSTIHFLGEHHLPIGESAASFISRVGAMAHTPDTFKL